MFEDDATVDSESDQQPPSEALTRALQSIKQERCKALPNRTRIWARAVPPISPPIEHRRVVGDVIPNRPGGADVTRSFNTNGSLHDIRKPGPANNGRCYVRRCVTGTSRCWSGVWPGPTTSTTINATPSTLGLTAIANTSVSASPDGAASTAPLISGGDHSGHVGISADQVAPPLSLDPAKQLLEPTPNRPPPAPVRQARRTCDPWPDPWPDARRTAGCRVAWRTAERRRNCTRPFRWRCQAKDFGHTCVGCADDQSGGGRRRINPINGRIRHQGDPAFGSRWDRSAGRRCWITRAKAGSRWRAHHLRAQHHPGRVGCARSTRIRYCHCESDGRGDHHIASACRARSAGADARRRYPHPPHARRLIMSGPATLSVSAAHGAAINADVRTTRMPEFEKEFAGCGKQPDRPGPRDCSDRTLRRSRPT